MCVSNYIAKPEKIIRNQNFKCFLENNFNIFLKRTFEENLIIGEITMFMDGKIRGPVKFTYCGRSIYRKEKLRFSNILEKW